MIQIISEHAEDILMGFHQQLAKSGDYSDAVIGSQIAVARDFVSWYESKTGTVFRIHEVPRLLTMRYQAALRARGMQPTTAKQHHEIVRSLFRWAGSAQAPTANRRSLH
jgi:site-specific recombinase XerD